MLSTKTSTSACRRAAPSGRRGPARSRPRRRCGRRAPAAVGVGDQLQESVRRRRRSGRARARRSARGRPGRRRGAGGGLGLGQADAGASRGWCRCRSGMHAPRPWPGQAQRVAGGAAALLHRRRGERGRTDHVADGVDVRHRGAAVGVDLEEAARAVRARPARVEAEAVEVGDSRPSATSSLSLVEPAPSSSGGLDARRRRSRRDLVEAAATGGTRPPARSNAARKCSTSSASRKPSGGRPRVDHVTSTPSGGEDRRVLARDDAAAEHDQRARQVQQRQDRVAVEDVLVVDRDSGGSRGREPVAMTTASALDASGADRRRRAPRARRPTTKRARPCRRSMPLRRAGAPDSRSCARDHLHRAPGQARDLEVLARRSIEKTPPERRWKPASGERGLAQGLARDGAAADARAARRRARARR